MLWDAYCLQARNMPHLAIHSVSGNVQVDNRTKFYLSAAGGGLGILVTLLFVPDVTSLNLHESDRRWEAICSGGNSVSCPCQDDSASLSPDVLKNA